MTTSETFMLDSNVIIYAHQSLSPFYAESKTLRDAELEKKIPICVCPQVLLEFFAVATNPQKVTNPIGPKEAIIEVKKYLVAVSVLKIYPGIDLIDRMLGLFRKYPVQKHEIFDLQLVATMLSNGINRLVTYNQRHFDKFKEIKVYTPRVLIAP